VDPEQLDALCRTDPGRPRIVILNYPSNPTGGTYGFDELQGLAEVARRYRVILLSDEIYGKLHHRGEHRSIVPLYPEGTVFSGGLSKWCGATAARLSKRSIVSVTGSTPRMPDIMGGTYTGGGSLLPGISMKGDEMKTLQKIVVSALAVVLLGFLPTDSGAQDVEGAKDHPLFNRLPDYHIDTYRESEFDSYNKFVASDGSYTTVEGRYYYINYYFDEGTQYLSEAAIKRNYSEALKRIGGVVEYEDRYNVYMSLDKGGKVTWVHVGAWNRGQGVGLYIIEEKAMEQVIVADADALMQEINLTGKAAVYGIYFDTGKAVVKPESGPALAEIEKLLQKNSDMKIYVVGHTDSVGEFDNNMGLSQRRAAAVVEVLVSEHGVDRSRLEPHGVGPLVPASTNTSEDGRAMNRRVELVER
jgi:outer membrane protein OmpA-like peptidoglycan-associated protein